MFNNKRISFEVEPKNICINNRKFVVCQKYTRNDISGGKRGKGGKKMFFIKTTYVTTDFIVV